MMLSVRPTRSLSLNSPPSNQGIGLADLPPLARPRWWIPSDLLDQVQSYLGFGADFIAAGRDLQRAWDLFFDLCAPLIRRFAFAAGANDEIIEDCTQAVWSELIESLPCFRLEPERGHFESWLYKVVQSKTANVLRAHKRAFRQASDDALDATPDRQPNPAQVAESVATAALFWEELETGLSQLQLAIFHLRRLEKRRVADIATLLGLTAKQVRSHCHRACKQARKIARRLGLHP